MPNLVMSGDFTKQQLEKDVKAMAYEFLTKLAVDDTTPGLHIEKINNAVDPRVRTGRVNIQYRAVLYRLANEGTQATYLLAGVWNHDDAIKYAQTHKLQVNPVNGVAELIQETQPEPTAVEEEVSTPSAPAKTVPVLKTLNFIPADLIDGFGFSKGFAEHVFALLTEDAVRTYATTLPTAWHADVLDGMLAGMSIDEIKHALDLVPPTPEEIEQEGIDIPTDETTAELAPSTAAEGDDARLLAALRHPAAKVQWKFIDDNTELREIIDSGDLGSWRVFLHPEQRRYVDRDYKGPFRLTGGAGTGKTVVLLHRARRLALAHPNARVILTTYTRQLAANLQRDLERLDASVPIATELGDAGVLIRGIDQLAVAIRKTAAADFSKAAISVVGEEVGVSGAPVGNGEGWDDAIAIAGSGLPPALQSAPFLEAEYLQVVLPNRIVALDDYRMVRRPGRGVSLDRAKRDAVWAVVERQRINARLANKLAFADAAEIAATYLELNGTTLADHVLVDEGQDLLPSHWKLLRALVLPGPNDIFLAEDSHQRIYGQSIALSRYNIAIRGRSRRLSLNYRTTAQNLRYAFSLLEGGEYVNPEGIDEGYVLGQYRSARTGPAPRIVATTTTTEQVATVAKTIRSWLEAGVPAGSIAVLTATQAGRLQEKLVAAGVPAAEPKRDDISSDKVVVHTMHRAKGLEFGRVILFDVSKGNFPPPATIKGVLEEDMPEVLSKAKALLYVAASRARDELMVTYQVEPSELLALG